MSIFGSILLFFSIQSGERKKGNYKRKKKKKKTNKDDKAFIRIVENESNK
jgi:hypothetical protein